MFLPSYVSWMATLSCLFFLGLLAGAQINRGIYRLAWFRRPIGPWSAPDPKAPPRRPYDKIPVVGWIALRRESSLHGRGYWLRPLLIELVCGAAYAGLYWWEISGRLLPAEQSLVPPSPAMLHAQYFSHIALLSLMMVATFIDIDEKTIPDEITVPGLLLGLIFAALLPGSHLPVISAVGAPPLEVVGLSITTPHPWPAWLHQSHGLAIGLACFAGWIYGILPKTWWTRGGMLKAFRYLAASIVRDRGLPYRLGLLVVGWAGIVAVWLMGGARWQALLTALVGMALAGGLIWAVRVIAGYALQVEAMGFGDVTLMAMIGAYVGWQSSLIVFFLSPFAALLVALAQLLLSGRKDIAYGPYLCLSTLIVIVGWRTLWQRVVQYFEMGWFLPGILLVCLVLMAVLLLGWGTISRRLVPR